MTAACFKPFIRETYALELNRHATMTFPEISAGYTVPWIFTLQMAIKSSQFQLRAVKNPIKNCLSMYAGLVMLIVTAEWMRRKVTTQMTNTLQTFVNPCLRRIMDVRWPKTISYTVLWEATGEKPIILQIGMRKWRLICHTSRKGLNPLKNKHWIGIRWEPEGEDDRSNLEKDRFGGSRKLRQNMQ